MGKVVGILLAGILAGLGIWFYVVHREPARHTMIVYEAGRSYASLPLYLASTRGFFARQGINVKLYAGGVIPPRLTARVDVQILPFDRLPPDSVAFAVLTNYPDYFLYGRKATGVFKWENAKKKVFVGLEPHADGEVLLEHILRQHRLRPQTDATILQDLPAELRRPAWEAGTGDYILLPQPEGLFWEQKGRARFVAPLQEGEPLLGTVCVAPRASLATREDLYARFAAGLYLAQQWMKTCTAEELAAAAGCYFPHLNHATLLRGITLYRETGMWAATPAPVRSAYDRLQEMRQRAGEIASPPPFTRCVDPHPAARAIKLVEEEKEKAPSIGALFRTAFPAP